MKLTLYCDLCGCAATTRMLGVDAGDCNWILIECEAQHQRWIRSEALAEVELGPVLAAQAADALAAVEVLLREARP